MRALKIWLAVSAALAFWVQTVSAREVGKGWMLYGDLKQALETAAARDIPVCILCQFKESGSAAHEARALVFEGYPLFSGTLKVCVYCEYIDKMDRETSAKFRDLWDRIDTRIVPFIFLTDGEGHVVGFAHCESPSNKWAEAVNTAKSIAAWKKQTRAALTKVERAIAAKQFNQAQAEVDRLAGEDKKYTATADRSYPHAPQDIDDKPKAPAQMSEQEKEDLRLKKARQERQFFYDAVEALREKLKQAVKDEYKNAETLKESGRFKEALAAVRRLVNCTSDKEVAAKAKELEQKILELQKTSPAAGASQADTTAPPAGEKTTTEPDAATDSGTAQPPAKP